MCREKRMMLTFQSLELATVFLNGLYRYQVATALRFHWIHLKGKNQYSEYTGNYTLCNFEDKQM